MLPHQLAGVMTQDEWSHVQERLNEVKNFFVCGVLPFLFPPVFIIIVANSALHVLLRVFDFQQVDH